MYRSPRRLRLKVRKGSEEYEKILTVLERRCERGETKEGAVVYRGKDTVATLEDRGDYVEVNVETCLLYTSPSPRDLSTSRMPSSA